MGLGTIVKEAVALLRSTLPARIEIVATVDADVPTVRLVFLTKRMLERLGYRVSGYTSAAEALAAVRADPGRFDLLATDFSMPGISGLDVAVELVRLRPDLPVALTSGYVTG